MEIENNLHVENVSRETFEEIEWYFHKHLPIFKKYIRQIQWWNTKFNLVSRNVTDTILLEHIKHSLVPCITETFWKAKNIVDAGTGSGLPGIPLSVIHDDAKFHLIDNNLKKMTAVKQIIAALNFDDMSITNECISIEDYQPAEKSLLVSKHAFKLNEFATILANEKYSDYLFLKGLDFKSELNTQIEENFEIKAYNLETGTYLSFFKQKYLVHLSRKIRNE